MLGKTRFLMGPLRMAAVLVLAFLSAGCGSVPKGTVSGKVLYQGKPLTAGGTVTFIPEQGGAFSAVINKDGSYNVAGIPLGAVKIAVVPDPAASRGNIGMQVPSDRVPEGVDLSQTSLASMANRGRRPPPPPIPGKYANPDQSGLTYTVKSGRQTYDIELK
jgi:hypothetical protein